MYMYMYIHVNMCVLLSHVDTTAIASCTHTKTNEILVHAWQRNEDIDRSHISLQTTTTRMRTNNIKRMDKNVHRIR
jgi:hypothetical protein